MDMLTLYEYFIYGFYKVDPTYYLQGPDSGRVVIHYYLNSGHPIALFAYIKNFFGGCSEDQNQVLKFGLEARSLHRTGLQKNPHRLTMFG